MNLHSKTEEEFSLLILWRIITKYKLMIFIMVILSGFITTFYSSKLKTKYKVSATIHQDYFNVETLDPTIFIFPYDSTGVERYSGHGVKDIFISNLDSDKYKNSFFIKENLHDNKINFKKEFDVNRESLSRTDNIWIVHENADFAKKLLSDYIIFSEKEMVKQLSSNIEKSIVAIIFEREQKLGVLENMVQNNIAVTSIPVLDLQSFDAKNSVLKFKETNHKLCAGQDCSDKALNDRRLSILALKKIKINRDLVNIVKSVSHQVKVSKHRDTQRGLIITLGVIFSILFGILTSFFLNFINTQSPKHKISAN